MGRSVPAPAMLFTALLLQCFSSFEVVNAKAKDYYAVLEVARNADDATIKRAYRKLSLK